MMRTWFALAVVALSGCDLYFTGGDDDPCSGGGAKPDIAYAEYWDPSTGNCIPGYGGGYCDYTCGPCPANEGAVAQPDMGMCYSECTGLDEPSCVSTYGCHATYVNDSVTDGPPEYIQCTETAPSGPVQGSCEGLDAHECSRHDDCALIYNADYNSGDPGDDGYGMKFAACVRESPRYCASDNECGDGTHCDTTACYPPPGCGPNDICPGVCYGICVPDDVSCTNVLCGPGYHCEEQCYPYDPVDGMQDGMGYCTTACVPDTSSCTLLDCGPGYECVETCEVNGNGTLWCGAYCSPVTPGDPGSCYGDVWCDSVPPQCPTGTTAGILNNCWSGYCIPNSACGPNDPGTCYDPVACDALPPACPMGTQPGVVNGCWSGYCIPDWQCESTACEALTSEAACTSRWDCTPVYTGTNCTCSPDNMGCTCETLTYERCESAYYMTP